MSAVESVTAAACDLLSRRADLELRFVRHRTSGTVHVVVPHDPHENGSETRFDGLPPELVVDVAVGALPTLCGFVARTHLGGAGLGDQRIEEFDDELLCRRCYRALGEHAARAFEHPVPAPSRDRDGDR